MARQRVITPRTVLGMILVACGLIFLGAQLQDDGKNQSPPQNTPSASASLDYIDELCSLIYAEAQRKHTGSALQEYANICADAGNDHEVDRIDACKAKLHQLDKMLRRSKLAGVDPKSITTACKSARIEV